MSILTNMNATTTTKQTIPWMFNGLYVDYNNTRTTTINVNENVEHIIQNDINVYNETK